MKDHVVTYLPTGWSVAMGVLLIILGLFAVAIPLFAGIAISMILGWLILLGGAAHFTYAWFERGAGAVLWQILIGIVYAFAALWILFHPLGGVAAMTLILAFYLAMEGALELAVFGAIHSLPGTVWFLVDGIISLLIAGLILFRWPSSSAWAIGTLIGVSLIMSGVARLTMPVQRHLLTVRTI